MAAYVLMFSALICLILCSNTASVLIGSIANISYVPSTMNSTSSLTISNSTCQQCICAGLLQNLTFVAMNCFQSSLSCVFYANYSTTYTIQWMANASFYFYQLPPPSDAITTTTTPGCSATYDQCGGTNWAGWTTCCTGSACIYNSQYYSQCIPISGVSSSSSSTISTTTVASGNVSAVAGVTTRNWDCCKPSCSWPGKAIVSSPVQACTQDGNTSIDPNIDSICTGGSSYLCNNQQPWSVNDSLSYGYAAAYLPGQSESTWCCACYSLVFTSGSVAGKELIVQVTNTGGDLGSNQFDLQMPGGGVGYFTTGCTSQYPGNYTWGAQYGGISQRSDCDNLPSAIQAGCYWRFDWFMDADNPNILFTLVSCPAALTANTQCIRQ